MYSVVINRPLGRVFAAAAHVVGLTPNQVTMISAAFTFTGIVVLAAAPPSALTGLIVCVALVLGYGLDAADGQLARLRGGGSPLGEWLDHLIDSVKIATLHTAVLIMVYRHVGNDSAWLIAPLVFGAVSVVHFFGMLLTDLLERNAASGTPRTRTPSRLMSAAKLPTDYGLLCLGFILLGLTPVFLTVYSLMALATLGYTVLVLPRWYARVKALGQVGSATVPPSGSPVSPAAEFVGGTS